MVELAFIGQLWMSLLAPTAPPTELMYGSWQSCQLNNSVVDYAEAIVDFKRGVQGIRVPFELHLGPRNEFTVQGGIVDAHRPHAESAWHVDLSGVDRAHARLPNVGGQGGIQVDVVRAGGSRDACESFLVAVCRGSRLNEQCPSQ